MSSICCLRAGRALLQAVSRRHKVTPKICRSQSQIPYQTRAQGLQRPMSSEEPEGFRFGPFHIQGSEVFVKSDHSFAFVNLKPVVPGHVLVSSKRVAHRFADLSSEEVSDLWQLVHKVGKVLEPHFQADSLTLTIQDGPAAGQTVPHVHVHILPRKFGDFANNDDIYDAIDASSKDIADRSGEKLDLDAARKVRTQEEMAQEAAELRVLFV